MIEFGWRDNIWYKHMVAGFKLYVRGGHVVLQWHNTMESGFLCRFNGFQLVHSMCLDKRDSLPSGLAHKGCAMYCHLGFLLFGSMKEETHGGDLPSVRYAYIELICLHNGLVYGLITWPYSSSLLLLEFCRCCRVMRASVAQLCGLQELHSWPW